MAEQNPEQANNISGGEPESNSLDPLPINYALNSEDFKSWPLANQVKLESNWAIAPDGTVTATNIRILGENNLLMCTWAGASGQTWTVSFWAKSISPFTLVSHVSDGVLGESFSSELKKDWQQFFHTMVFSESEVLHGSFYLTFHTQDQPSFQAWGVQIELGDVVTPYKATHGQAVMRTPNNKIIKKELTFEVALGLLWGNSFSLENIEPFIKRLGFNHPTHFGDLPCGGLNLQHIPSELAKMTKFLVEYFSKDSLWYLEVGVGNCGTMIFLHEIFKKNRIELKIFGIDNLSYQHQNILEFQDISINWARNNLNAVFYIGDTRKAECVSFLERKSFDIIFIDGDHSYDGCTNDFLLCLPYLKPGGMMIFHDIASIQCPGVIEGYQKFKEYFKYSIEFIDSDKCGIGICYNLLKKPTSVEFPQLTQCDDF